jgi:hypothetical protein
MKNLLCVNDFLGAKYLKLSTIGMAWYIGSEFVVILFTMLKAPK